MVRLRGDSPELIGTVVSRLCEAAPVHNVAFLGGDTFFFARSPSGESSSAVPFLKVGTTQLLGHYVVDSTAQFDAAMEPGAIHSSLRSTRMGNGTDEDTLHLLAKVVAQELQ